MRAVLLHLSDIHLTSGFNPILGRVKEIAATLNLCCDEKCACFLVISGDIGRNGNSQEYVEARGFISDLLREIQSIARVTEAHIVIVPGNHDCNFEGERSTRDALVRHLYELDAAADELDRNYVADVSSVQEEFFRFANTLDTTDALSPGSLFWIRKYQLDQYTVIFACFDTAWMSTRDEQQGKLFLPSKLVGFDPGHADKNTLLISVFHHPYSWFDADKVSDFKSLVNNHSDMVITGHEHDPENETVFSARGAIRDVMQGGILQSARNRESSFNIEVIDLERRIQKKFLLVWDVREDYYATDTETDWLPFPNLEQKVAFSLKEDFRRWLSRLDVHITHPRSMKPLEVDEIYVNPTLEIERTKDGVRAKTSETTNRMQHFLSIIKEHRKVLVLGNKYYGKTLLLKRVFTSLLEDDVVPLCCRGKHLRRLAKQSKSAIHELFERQYNNERDIPYARYRQLPIERRALLVDDIDEIELNIRVIEALLDELENHFGLLVLTANPIINVNEVFNCPGALIEYTRVKFNDFGLPVIDQMVEKWVRLANPNSPEPEIQNKIKTLENNLFHVLGRDIIPRNPFFILTILHNLQKSDSPEAQSGAYGYYFQTIINVMIAKVVQNPNQIGYIYDYFSNLAFYMLEGKTGKISKSDLERLNAGYLERTGFTLDLQQVIRHSVREEILVEEGDSYSFGFNYYFEFFSAKYLGDNIRNPKMQERIRNIVEQMAMHIHKEVYSNIMMFLCFHTKDPIVLEIITGNAQRVFKSMEILDFDKDVEFLNTLSPYPRIRQLSGRPTQDTKRELLEATDLVTSEIAGLSHSLSLDVKSLEELDIVNRILYAFAAVRVLGQIIRRYLPGDLEDRVALAKECYDLGLKTIKYVFSEIEKEMPAIQEGLALCILQRNPSITASKLSSATSDWIWALSQSICMSSIKNISHHVGAPELQKVYDLILRRHPNQAYEFIDISIELDHHEDLPESKIERLAKKLQASHNTFCEDLLRLLFVYHVYQFYTPVTKMQRLLAILGLQRLITEPNVFLPARKALPRGKTAQQQPE